MSSDAPQPTMSRRKVKKIVLRTRAKAMAEDEWLREYLRDPKRREKNLRGTLAFTRLTGLSSEELANG